MRIGGCDLCESVAAMMRILSQGRSRLHYGVFVTPLVPPVRRGRLALGRTVAMQSANCIRLLTAQRVVRAAAVREHGTPSSTSDIPSRQIVPTRHHHR